MAFFGCCSVQEPSRTTVEKQGRRGTITSAVIDGQQRRSAQFSRQNKDPQLSGIGIIFHGDKVHCLLSNPSFSPCTIWFIAFCCWHLDELISSLLLGPSKDARVFLPACTNNLPAECQPLILVSLWNLWADDQTIQGRCHLARSCQEFRPGRPIFVRVCLGAGPASARTRRTRDH